MSQFSESVVEQVRRRRWTVLGGRVMTQSLLGASVQGGFGAKAGEVRNLRALDHTSDLGHQGQNRIRQRVRVESEFKRDCSLPVCLHHQCLQTLGRFVTSSWMKPATSPSLIAKVEAFAFHAKDDLPEVRREVFRLIPILQPKIVVAIRRKQELAELAQELHRVSGRKITQGFVYEDLVGKVCVNLRHNVEENRVVFARRGKADRNVALSHALKLAKIRINRTWGPVLSQRCVALSIDHGPG